MAAVPRSLTGGVHPLLQCIQTYSTRRRDGPRYDTGMDRTRVTGVVLAGGRSSRFGRDKALLEIGGETLLARTVRTLDGLAGEVLVLGPPERAAQAPGARVIPDERPGEGPLPAIAMGLREMHGDRMIAVATDMPLLNPTLLAYLLDRSEGYDVTLPHVAGRGQQLHAVYARACLPHIEAQLAHNDLKIDRFFGTVRTLVVGEEELARVDPELLSFRNVNTEAEWAEVRRILGVEA